MSTLHLKEIENTQENLYIWLQILSGHGNFAFTIKPKKTCENLSSQLALDLVEAPEEIAWLDLSFNHIEEVTDDILEWAGFGISQFTLLDHLDP